MVEKHQKVNQMKDEEFEKYFRDITNCMYDCTITKAERRAKLKEILEEIENNAKGEVLHQVFDKEAKP